MTRPRHPDRDRLILHELMHEFVQALDGNTELAVSILRQCVARVDAELRERYT